jgi:hypothetical protein
LHVAQQRKRLERKREEKEEKSHVQCKRQSFSLLWGVGQKAMRILPAEGRCWRCGRFLRVGARTPGRFRTCASCRAYLTRRTRMTMLDAQKFCERIARLFGATCRIRVLPVLPDGKVWFSFEDRRKVAHHSPARRGSGGRLWPCSIALIFRDYRSLPRRSAFQLLLEDMLHEVAHHFEPKAKHGNRWRSRCAALARTFGLTLKDCL